MNGFSACLLDGRPAPSSAATRAAHNLGPGSSLLLLAYVAVYSGWRLPLLNSTVQQPAFERWATPFWPLESALTTQVRSWAASRDGGATPRHWYAAAATVCAEHGFPEEDVLCPALLCHNVLRTLGRHSTAKDSHGVDYNPPWFRSDVQYWTKQAVPLLEQRMVPLRASGERADMWGPWYHTFGILTFMADQVAGNGPAVGCFTGSLTAQLNSILGQFLGGGVESAEKARIDVDAAAMACAVATAAAPPAAGFDCGAAAAYVAVQSV